MIMHSRRLEMLLFALALGLASCSGGSGSASGPFPVSATSKPSPTPVPHASPSASPGTVLPSASPSGRPSTSPSGNPIPSPSASPVQIQSEQARASDAFVDSIGVNTHFSYAGSAYDSSSAESALEALGVRHIRDVSPGITQAGHFEHLAPHGIRFDSIWQIAFFAPPVSSWNPTPDGYASTVGLSNFDSYEGTNESNQSCSGNSSWVSQTRAQQSALFAYMQSHGLSSLPLLAPSYGTCVSLTAYISDANAMGSLSAYSNYGNVHWYPAPIANYPEDSCLDAAQSSICSGSYWLEAAGIENPGQPVIVTETGNESQSGGCQKNSGTIGQERYDLRLLLNDWNVGIVKTYLFEMLDDYANDKCYFGLMSDSYVAKPSYTALQNLATTLADPGYTAFGAGKLQYALGGNLTNVDHVLLEKHGGAFELVLWQGVASVDNNGNPVAVAPQTVTLSFPTGPTSIDAQTFSDTGTLSPVTVSTSNHVSSLVVTDVPVIITIAP